MADGVPAAGKAQGSRFDTDNAALQPSPVHLTTTAPDSLDAARLLADTGQLTEAAAICESYLAGKGPSAEAYYLLGLMKDAADDPEAITYYRKALYLEPNHYEALVHIALWLEKNGDLPGAQPFKRRAERAQPAE
jgi:chemotaxis protein methyltransferase WspC